MDKTSTLEPTVEEEMQAKAGVAYYLAEIKRLNEQMQSENAALESSRAQSQILAQETRFMLADLKRTLERLF